MLKSLIEVRRNARGEKFKQFFSLLITKTASWSQTFLAEMLETRVENREPASVPKTSPWAPGVVRLFLNAGYFFWAWQGRLPHLSGVPHLHANKPIKGRRYESFNLVTCQTTRNCVTWILTSRFWHDRSSCHAFAACRRKKTGECWCTSP